MTTPNIRTITSRSFIALSVATLLLLFPGTSFAADGSDTCTPPPQTQSGARRPTGADADTYTYNCDSGLWENAHFTYNPTTQTTTPKDATVYTYNASTGMYDFSDWHYSPAKGDFYQLASSVATPPVGATKIGGPVPAAASTTPAHSTPESFASGSDEANSDNNGDGDTNSSSGGGSTNSTTNLKNRNTITNNTNASLNNSITATGTSGSATVLGNTQGGSATSGDVTNEADVINMLQSSSNALGDGSNVKTFSYDINGDVYGDLFFDPNAISKVQDASTNTEVNNATTINNNSNTAINNDINLTAKSGDATVAKNTAGGDATSGNATNIANIVNAINSTITSGQSFIGTININGNLNGDILIPSDFVDQLIASNVPTVSVTVPGSDNNLSTNVANTATVNNTNNLSAHNTVNATANSGNATVSKNTQGGTATSGSASNTSASATHITAFNLTGRSIVGSNSMLVFVNVLGKWVGLIVNAPAGATAAQIGGGITSNTTINNDTTVNNTTNTAINNNLNLDAESGDATVTGNTKGGNARSGNASNAVNISNVENSAESFANWFGILFINVFGSWNGSFGVNTAAGNPVTPGGRGAETPTATTTAATVSSPVQAFRFVPTSSATSSSGSNLDLSDFQQVASSVTTAAAPTTDSGTKTGVLAAETTAPKAGSDNQASRNTSNLWKSASLIFTLVVLFIVADAINARRKRAQ